MPHLLPATWHVVLHGTPGFTHSLVTGQHTSPDAHALASFRQLVLVAVRQCLASGQQNCVSLQTPSAAASTGRCFAATRCRSARPRSSGPSSASFGGVSSPPGFGYFPFGHHWPLWQPGEPQFLELWPHHELMLSQVAHVADAAVGQPSLKHS